MKLSAVSLQLELFPVRYVRVQCYGTDQRTGEPRQWHHRVDERTAAYVAKAIEALWPDVRVEVM